MRCAVYGYQLLLIYFNLVSDLYIRLVLANLPFTILLHYGVDKVPETLLNLQLVSLFQYFFHCTYSVLFLCSEMYSNRLFKVTNISAMATNVN